MITQINKQLFIEQLENELELKFSKKICNNIFTCIFETFDRTTIREIEHLPSVEFFIDKCCERFAFERSEVISKSRKQEYVFLRHIFAYFFTGTYKLNQYQSADLLGIDRSSISHSVKTVKVFMESRDEEFMKMYSDCWNVLYSLN